ncbi:MAG: c-type cytochrome domain-containing protein [Syntrophobacteraceae bacterium]
MNAWLRRSLLLTCALTVGMPATTGFGLKTAHLPSFADHVSAAQTSPLSQTAAQSGKDTVSYADVAAIFSRSCNKCHSGSKPAQGLRTDSYPGIMAGGWNGPVVVPGNPARSELVRRIRGISTPRMPFKSPVWLSETEMGRIEQWIQAGAPDGKP